jgi:hypothetical protein
MKSFGGSQEEIVNDIRRTPDEGFIKLQVRGLTRRMGNVCGKN